MASVFISYSRKDGDFVKGLEKRLNDQHRDAWVDWRDILPTAEWWQEICSAIDNAHSFAFVVSPDSVTSAVCNQELDHAIKQHKRLIPIIRRDVPAAEIPKPLTILQWIFFREEDDFAFSLQALITAIDTDLDWVRAHTRLLVRSNEWDAKEKDKSFLLHGRDLEQAEVWLTQGADKVPSPTTVQTLYIQTSRQAATQFQRRLLGGVFIALLVAIGLAIYAFNQQRIATEEKNNAVEARKGEQAQRKNAQAKQKEAEEARDQAKDSARKESEAADKERKAREEEAHQRQIALARQLAAQAQLMVTNEQADLLPRSVLLAMESMRRLPSLEADQALRSGLTLLARPVIRLAHPGNVAAVTLSPDSKFMATACADGIARVWETITGRRIAALKHEGNVNALTFSPDGRYLATASDDRMARVWNMDTGDELFRVEHKAEVTAIAFDPDGRFLSTGSANGTATVWEVKTQTAVASLRHLNARHEPEGPISGLSFYPRAPYLATVVSGHTALIWELRTQRERGRIEFFPTEIHHSEDGRYFGFASSLSHQARILDLESDGKEVLRVNNADVIAFSPDGRYVASGSPEQSARVWQLPSMQEVAFLMHNTPVTALAFSRSGDYLATAGANKTVRVWKMSRDKDVARAFGTEVARMVHHTKVKTLVFSSDEEHVITVSEGGIVSVWGINNLREVISLNHTVAVFNVGFSPDGRLLATRRRGDHLGSTVEHIWEVPSGKAVLEVFGVGGQKMKPRLIAEKWLPNSTAPVRSAESTDRQFEAKADSNNVVRVYRSISHSGTQLSRSAIAKIPLAHKIQGLALSPDGKFLATVTEHDTARIWEVSNGREIARLTHEAPNVTDVAFSPPDGKYLATASWDGTARLWLWRPKDLLAEACSRLSRDLTNEEVRQYLRVTSYTSPCTLTRKGE